VAHDQAATSQPRWADDAVEESFWEEFAPGYDERSPLAASADAVIRDLQAFLESGMHLLEIGAGPGAFTRRLAPGLSRVTVVEPSATMRAEFIRLWEGPDIVDIVPLKWEDAPELQADVIFGANAFYRIREIAPALLKMTRLARHRIALLQTVGRPYANPLHVTLGGASAERERADAICDVLDELGIDHSRRDYEILRPIGPSRAALIDWRPR